MIDIHSHILPGFDDGVENLKQSLQLGREYQRGEISSVIATPHIKDGQFDITKDKILSSVEMLNVEFAIAGLEVDVYAGAEYFMDIRVLKDLESGSLVTLGRSRSVLLEFPGTHIPKYSDKIIEILTGSGYTPVLAHPERCSDIVRNTDILGTFTEKGCKVQVDSRSFTGENGKSVMSAASRFLKKQMIDYIAFDIHRVFSLKKHIGILKKYIENIGGESLVTFLDAEEEFTKSSDLELRK